MKVSIGNQIDFKLVFAGSFGVGKSTAIRSISDIEVVNTDVKSLEVTKNLIDSGKTTTTVGFDYGELHLPGTRVALYGLPGQERFNDIWQKLLTKESGVILMLYGDKSDAIDECKAWLDTLKTLDAVRYLTVVITRVPKPTPNLLIEPFRELVREYNPFAPVMTADPREKNHMIQAVMMAVANPEFKLT